MDPTPAANAAQTLQPKDAPAPVSRPLLPIDPAVPCRPDELMVAHYNVENLFDAIDDPATNDQPYTPALTGYSDEHLALHVRNLARVIRQMNGGRGPDVLALTEIENGAVVEKLARDGLADLGYQVAHREDADARGIEPAVLTRFPVVGQPIQHPVVNEAGKRFRSILEVTVEVNGRPLTLLVNHWIATRTGQNEEKSAGERLFTAATLKAIVDRKLAEDPDREIVILGDFNEDLNGRALGEGLQKASTVEDARERQQLFDTVDALAADKAALGPEGDGIQLGTHYYVPASHWSTYDHLLVSHTLLDGEGLAWVPGSTAVFAPDSLRDATGAPRRFFLPRKGERTVVVDPEGASDHFPVAMRLRKVGTSRRPPDRR